MRTQAKFLGWLSCLLFSFVPGLAQSAQPTARIGEGTHLYLRCNATNWDVNEANRLKSGAQSFLRELTFEVKKTWMTEGGDDCVITETPERNAWGAWQNYYGAPQPTLHVPESAWLRTQLDSAENMVFKVRFPSLGRYRFVMNTRDGFFSIHKVTTPRTGEVAWTLPGKLIRDAQGQHFLSASYQQNSLSLVDTETGLLRWTYRTKTPLAFHDSCSTQDTAFVTIPGRVLALSNQDGREIWSTDLNGDLQGQLGSLSCHPVHKQMYLSYGAEQTTFVSLVPRTGQVLWAWMAPARAGILGVDGRQVLISIQQNGLSAIAALSMVTGRELWQADLRAGYYSLTEDGSLFWMESSRLTALEPATGQVLWSYAGEPNHHLWLSFEKNGLYVHERSRISSLDRRNGRVVWVHHYNVPAAMNPHAEILESGVVLVQILDHTSRVSRQIALNCWTGQVIWEREDTGTSSFMSEGNQQGAWRINGKVLQAVDPWTGAVRWSFTLNSTVSTENILKVLEQDKNTVYVGYGRVSDRDPPMGVLALDMKTGALLWQSWLDATLSRVGGDGRTLILNAGPHGTTKALLK